MEKFSKNCVFIGTTLLLVVFSATQSAHAKTAKIKIDVLIDGRTEKRVVVTNRKVQTLNQYGKIEKVLFEHLRFYDEREKYPLFSSYRFGSASWCKALGFRYYVYSQVGRYEKDFHSKKMGLFGTRNGTIIFREKQDSYSDSYPINYLVCSNNKKDEY